ncbi:keratin, type I cytoskeletal 9-like [Macrosteles quadrilineatus]|uniref:keratin, type I cytoskeletal 9-like n=1 Tax=Macrosteles quadrilineatus TaxID=74068 RepID=UPI0023E348CA|nr:keratin, type I cytoskeletal 9-like [Macrosteles quadrilineatus]
MRWLLIVLLGVWCCVISSGSEHFFTPQQLKNLDEKIISFLNKPTNASDWETLVKDMENLVEQIKVYRRLMRDKNDQEIVRKSYEIYQTGKPKFIYHTMSEPEIRDAAQVTKEDMEHFHILRDKIDNLWDEFLDIISEKTGEILVYEKPPGFENYDNGYGGGYGDDDTPGHGRGWGWQGGRGGEYGRGRGRGRGRRRGGGGYGNDFGSRYR